MNEFIDWAVLGAFILCVFLVSRSIIPTPKQKQSPNRWLSAVVGLVLIFAVGGVLTVTGY